MRLALSTTAFARALARGDQTQLELLDACAGELHVDGVVLDAAQFPRRDSDYLAQVKKFCADLALTIVAVRDDGLTAGESDALVLASHLGAPYVLTRMPERGNDPVMRWNEALGLIGRAASEAKKLNVTLAVRNVPGSLAADNFEMGRLRKESDTAWLCFALDPLALAATPDEKVRKHLVLAYTDSDADPVALDRLGPFGGFLCVDVSDGSGELAAVKRRLHGWRSLLAQAELFAEPHVPSDA
jgi:sugar phosphate isomerase/epimerase